MSGPPVDRGTPLVLLVNDEEWTTRSLESILRPEGYAVLTAHSGKQGLELASKVQPDLLLVDLRLPDIGGVDLCGRLRELSTIRPSTPILLFSSGPVRRQDELDALHAGAWGILTPPFDPQELLARIRPFVSAKRDADEALDASYLDPLTGFYNVQGIIQRVSEISADTNRSHRALACLVLGPSRTDSTAGVDEAPGQIDSERESAVLSRTVSAILLASTRLSDIVGRVGSSDFVIIAPGTDQDGAERLAERLMEAAEAGDRDNVEVVGPELKAGLYAISGSEPEVVVPQEFLRRATAALREAQSDPSAADRRNRIRRFQTS